MRPLAAQVRGGKFSPASRSWGLAPLGCRGTYTRRGDVPVHVNLVAQSRPRLVVGELRHLGQTQDPVKVREPSERCSQVRPSITWASSEDEELRSTAEGRRDLLPGSRHRPGYRGGARVSFPGRQEMERQSAKRFLPTPIWRPSTTSMGAKGHQPPHERRDEQKARERWRAPRRSGRASSPNDARPGSGGWLQSRSASVGSMGTLRPAIPREGTRTVSLEASYPERVHTVPSARTNGDCTTRLEGGELLGADMHHLDGLTVQAPPVGTCRGSGCSPLLLAKYSATGWRADVGTTHRPAGSSTLRAGLSRSPAVVEEGAVRPRTL